MIAIIEWVMSIEEMDLVEGGYIPEEKRIRMHTLMWQVDEDQIHVQAKQGGADTDMILHKAILQLR